MRLLYGIVLVFCSLALNAQLEITPAYIEHEGSHRAEDIEIDFTVENLDMESTEFYWRIVNHDDIPAPWEAALCDVNFCYTPEVSVCPEVNPNVLSAEASHVFAFHVYPHEGELNFTFVIELFAWDDPETVLATVEINLNTISSATDDEELAAGLTIFPNPTAESFQIKNDQDVNTIAIYNIVGKQIQQFNHVAGKTYDIENYRKGRYLVRLFDDSGNSIRALRLSKK